MIRDNLRVLDTFIGDGSVPTYTSLDHVQTLSSGRSLAFSVTVTNPAPRSKISMYLEQSNDGKNFQSKYFHYATPGDEADYPIPIYDHVELVAVSGAATAFAIEPAAGRPNLRFSRLAVYLFGSEGPGTAGRVVVNISVNGSPDDDDGDQAIAAAAPGTLAAHQDFAADVHRLASESTHLDPHQRAAHLLLGLSSRSKEHVREVDRRLMSLHPEARKAIISMVVDNVRRAVSSVPGAEPVGAVNKTPCCDGAAAAKPSPGGCGCG